jgi:hypothetical protein
MSDPRPRPPGMRRSARDKFYGPAKARLLVDIDTLVGASGLTTVELILALAEYQNSLLRELLREERHSDDPDQE